MDISNENKIKKKIFENDRIEARNRQIDIDIDRRIEKLRERKTDRQTDRDRHRKIKRRWKGNNPKKRKSRITTHEAKKSKQTHSFVDKLNKLTPR